VSARRAVSLAAVVLAMWGLKRHYADAEVEDLRWILWPTARLVAAATGSPVELEPGAGYLSRRHLFLIEKSCAGVNFMIAALGLTGIALARDRRSRNSERSGIHYYAISVVVPLLNGARGVPFFEHVCFVLLVPPVLIAVTGLRVKGGPR
jgi:exosortase K